MFRVTQIKTAARFFLLASFSLLTGRCCTFDFLLCYASIQYFFLSISSCPPTRRTVSRLADVFIFLRSVFLQDELCKSFAEFQFLIHSFITSPFDSNKSTQTGRFFAKLLLFFFLLQISRKSAVILVVSFKRIFFFRKYFNYFFTQFHSLFTKIN